MCNFPSRCCLWAHPDGLQSFVFLVQAAVDVIGVEQRVSGDLAKQVPRKVADIVLAEVPLPQHSAGNHRLRVLMAALAEVTAEVFTVTQSLDVICGVDRQQRHKQGRGKN